MLLTVLLERFVSEFFEVLFSVLLERRFPSLLLHRIYWFLSHSDAFIH